MEPTNVQFLAPKAPSGQDPPHCWGF